LHLELFGLTLGLREAVIGLIVLVAAYMLFVLLRMSGLRTSRAAPSAPQVAPGPVPEEDVELPEPVYHRPQAQVQGSEDRRAEQMAEHVLQRGLEREVAQLREEVDAVRGELAALRADMLREMAHMRASQTVSPIYGDAMQMAVAGYDASMIAERCGIARAEAELVVALAKSQSR
jgi:hypothetical protein